MSDVISPWVRPFAPFIPSADVLDLACGAGRHARHLASLGARVIPRADFVQAVAAALPAPPLQWRFDPVYWRELVPLPASA